MESTTGVMGTAGFRRAALAAAMVVAPWGIVLANTSAAWETRHGGDDGTGTGALALAAAHPGAERFGMVAGMLGCLLMVPAVIGVMQLTRYRAAKLGLIGGVWTAAGYISYFGMLSADGITLAMAARGDHPGDYAQVLDASLNTGSVIWYYLVFLTGNLIGTLLLGLALFRSRSVPVWAAAAVIGWPVLHIAGIIAASEWFEVAGAVLQAVGFAVAARCLMSRADEDARPSGREASHALTGP